MNTVDVGRNITKITQEYKDEILPPVFIINSESRHAVSTLTNLPTLINAKNTFSHQKKLQNLIQPVYFYFVRT